MALHALLFLDARQSERRATQAPATMRNVDGAPFDVTIDDLSRHGFRLTTDAGLAADELFSIGIADIGRHPARVVRQTASGFGCEFVEPLSRAAALRAGRVQTVDHGPFAARDPADRPFAPVVEKLPGALRMVVIVGLGIAAWLLVILLIAIAA